MSLAILPGSFDPFTLGHLDIARRAAKVFDEVIIAVAVNPAKKYRFMPEARRDLIAQAVAELPTVRVEVASGLLVDFAQEQGATAIVKGLRGGSDFDAESPMALMNRHMTGIETMFIVGDQALAHISSSLVKDIASYGRDISDLVPAAVAAAMQAGPTS